MTQPCDGGERIAQMKSANVIESRAFPEMACLGIVIMATF